MRKTKKALASLAIAGMVLSMAPMSVFGATDVTRISDADRVGTAIAIAANGWTSADSVIVVPADDANIVDALAAAPLAGQLNAPILVTYKGALDPKVQQKIVDLKAKNVYAVGALSADTVASLKAISGVNVTALQGADRTETAAKVAAQLTDIKGSFVVAYNGTADAMSAASYAAANGYSILVENPDGTLPANEAAYKGAKQYTVGGQAKLDGATALAGADRYATNDAVLNGLDYKYDTVYVANGESLVDALAGASLAAKTNSPIVLADATKAATGVNDNVTASTKVVALGGVGAVPEAVRTQVGKTAPTGTVSVQSVSAISASSFKVVFTAAPADTTKVAITVTRNTTPVTVTTTWNDAKTEATVTSSANFPEGSYSVAVKNDATDLGTSTVAVTQQKVAKIEILSSKLAVTGVYGGAPAQYGYATYRVLDQYGNELKSSFLANNITFQSGVASSITAKDGVIKITPNTNLLNFANVVITGYDSTNGVTTSATLATSTALGTLSDITLNALTNADGKELTAGDQTSLFYITYKATDISGNETSDYNLVKNGLILTGTNSDELSVSNSYVTAKVVPDPSDSTKAALQVSVNSPNTISMDMPVTITAMSYSGKTSTLNLTLKKQAEVDSFTLMAPAYDIAVSESKEIPFVAYDQSGAQITKYSKLNGIVTLSGGLRFEQNVDGTARLVVDANANKGPQIVTAMTKTGKISTLTLNIQKAAIADSLSVDSSVLVSAMQAGATQAIDFGYDAGGLTVKDQYGRTIDMTGKPGSYRVYVTTSAAITASNVAYGGNQITVTANTLTDGNGAQIGGQGTITFKLVDVSETKNNATIFTGANYSDLTTIDSKSVTIANIADSDIKDYTMDTVANAIYTSTASATVAGGLTDKDYAYAAKPQVFGKTSSGAKVVLKGTPVTGVFSTSGSFLAVTTGGAIVTPSTPVAYDKVRLVAKKYDDLAKTTGSTTLTVNLIGADNKLHSLNTTVNSTNAAPVASAIDAYADTTIAGVSINSAHDVITLNQTTNGAIAAVGLNANNSLTKYDSTGTKSSALVYFFANDQYNSKAAAFSQVYVVSDVETNASGVTTNTVSPLAVNNSTGAITTNLNGYTPAAGTVRTITLSAVTNNGLVKTIQIVIK